MTTRATGPGAGLRWLISAVNLGSRNAKAVFGAAALLIVMALVPTAVQLAIGAVAGNSPVVAVIGLVLSLLYSIVVMPPLVGGFLRLIHRTESGTPVGATALFDMLRDTGDVLRMIGLTLLLLVVVLAVLVVFGLVLGADFLSGLMELMQQLEAAQGQAAPSISFPDGLGTFIALGTLIGLFLNGVYTLSAGQVAIGGRPVFAAVGDGFVGTLKNLLPLLVLLLVVLVAGFLAMLAIGLVAALVGFIGTMIHPVVGMLLIAPIYIALMIGIYVISFGVMYFMWRDICGDGVAAAPAPDRDDHVAM